PTSSLYSLSLHDALPISLGLLFAAPSFAVAQTVPRLQIMAGLEWPMPVKAGTTGGIEKAPDGSPFTLFNSSGTERGPVGVEAGVAFCLTKRLVAEGAGSIGTRELRTSIS